MYTGNVLWVQYNYDPKKNWSNKIGREEKEKDCCKAKLHLSKEWKKKDLILRIEHSHPSKQSIHSCQIHHIMQWGTSLHKAIMRC